MRFCCRPGSSFPNTRPPKLNMTHCPHLLALSPLIALSSCAPVEGYLCLIHFPKLGLYSQVQHLYCWWRGGCILKHSIKDYFLIKAICSLYSTKPGFISCATGLINNSLETLSGCFPRTGCNFIYCFYSHPVCHALYRSWCHFEYYFYLFAGF